MGQPCIICSYPKANVMRDSTGADSYEVSCKRCGRFIITGSLASTDLGQFGQLHLLSAVI
jgi:hypothetical protein